ncbi:DUF2062 domain-containing protein [Geotalea toluenoxydans]|uniref:DUF2062 domain-containing protein n=1 Tax=Geotalea toluenoxydans TaxID=421624 RepID=UPI000ADA3B8D|nr:DUF2062 domain-containing protein [Geotalea toluenoxydans]
MLNKEKWKKKIKAILSLDSHPGHISAGFAVGVFISFTPFFGLHTPMAIAAAFIFRLNKLTCITGAGSTPPSPSSPSWASAISLAGCSAAFPPRSFKSKLQWQHLEKHGTSLLLGTSILGFIAAVAAYFICYYLVVRFRQKDETLAELTKEMEETGEDME